MAEPISRLVSGTASMSIPPEWLEYREVYLSTALVRPPSNPYLNRNYAPPRSKYATITVLASGLYVREELQVDYELQYYTLFALQASQNLLALICALEAILQTFVNLANAIPDTLPINKVNPIENFTHMSPNVDRVVIKCYADTALFVSLIPVEMERCNPADGTPVPPPPPPEPPPKIPSGTPLDGQDGNPVITPPQEGEPPELNEPFPFDTEEPPSGFPQGDRCVIYNVAFSWIDSRDGTVAGRPDISVYGEIEYVDERNEQFLGAGSPVRFVDLFIGHHGGSGDSCNASIVETSLGGHYIAAGTLDVVVSLA